MYQISARGPRQDVETAWDALAWTDPSPADAVDGTEDTRLTWQLNAYTQTDAAARACVEIIRQVAPGLSPSVAFLADRNWVTLSLEGLPAVEAGRFIVAGSHVLTRAAPGKTAILIEAAVAFGTGHHGTTLGCLLGYEYVLRQHRPRRVLDVGTGSGVLAIAALKSGARQALGIDIDAESVRVADDNLRKNHVSFAARMRIGQGVRLAAAQAGSPYDLIFANILARPLTRLAPSMLRLLAPGGHIILSGLLTRQEPLVRLAYQARGTCLVRRIRRDGWSTLVFQRPASRSKD